MAVLKNKTRLSSGVASPDFVCAELEPGALASALREAGGGAGRTRRFTSGVFPPGTMDGIWRVDGAEACKHVLLGACAGCARPGAVRDLRGDRFTVTKAPRNGIRIAPAPPGADTSSYLRAFDGPPSSASQRVGRRLRFDAACKLLYSHGHRPFVFASIQLLLLLVASGDASPLAAHEGQSDYGSEP